MTNAHADRIDRLYSYVASTSDLREELPEVAPVDRTWLASEMQAERYLLQQDQQQNDLRR